MLIPESAAGGTRPVRADATDERRRLARLVLVAFLATFTWLRIMIFQTMDRRLPDMFVYVKGTHVHHLNIGIFLLAILGGTLLFGRPRGRGLKVVPGSTASDWP